VSISRLSRKTPSGKFDIRLVEVNLAEAKKGATVAVKVMDMLGEEVSVVKQVYRLSHY
jgi:hypothetical protein